MDDSEDNLIGSRRRVDAAAEEAAAMTTMAAIAAGGHSSSCVSFSSSRRRPRAQGADPQVSVDQEQEKSNGAVDDDDDDDGDDPVESEAARDTEPMAENDALQREPAEDEDKDEGEEGQPSRSAPAASEEAPPHRKNAVPDDQARGESHGRGVGFVDVLAAAAAGDRARGVASGGVGERDESRSAEQAHQEGGKEGGQSTAADAADGSSAVGAAAAIGPLLPPSSSSSPPPPQPPRSEDAEMYYPLGPPEEQETTVPPLSAARETSCGRRDDTDATPAAEAEAEAKEVAVPGGCLSREELRDAKYAARARALELSGGKEPYTAEALAYMREAITAASSGPSPYDNGSSLDDDDEDFDSDSEYDEELARALHESRQAEVQRMETVAGAAATAAAEEQMRAVGVAVENNTAAKKEEEEEEDGGGGDNDDPMVSGGAGEDEICSGKGGWENRMMEACLLDPQKVKAMFDDGYEETCPHYLSNLNWFLCLGGVEKIGARLVARPPPKATVVRGLVEILCMVAEVVSNDQVVMLLRDTLTNLDAYIASVSSEDLKRSPENRNSLFGAMDHVR